MNEWILTALDANKTPIASSVILAFDYSDAYRIAKELYPNATYWEVGRKL